MANRVQLATEIDADLKRELRKILIDEGRSVREWLEDQAKEYVAKRYNRQTSKRAAIKRRRVGKEG